MKTMSLFSVFTGCLLIINVHCTFEKKDFTTLYEWTQLEFDYPTPYDRQLDIKYGNFIPGKPAPIDTDVFYSPDGFNKIFVSIPRFQTGVPAALGTLFSKKFNGNPVISPYPSWDWHQHPEKCKRNRIISVYRVTIDECGRLWVLDTGRLINKIICPPQVLIFNLKTDTLIHRYEIPPDQYESRSIFVTPVVEVLNNQCSNSFAYLADCQAYSIVVYDLKRNKSWRVSDKTMFPYPQYGTFTIQGESFELMDGVLGMSLSPANDKSLRKLYYHAMSSPTENWVYTYILRNESLFTTSTPTQFFNTFPGQRLTQVPAEAVDSNGIMYFGLVSNVEIACFNTKGEEYGSWKTSDIIASNPLTLQFASGVKVIKNKKGEEELWILTSRFQKVATGSLSVNEVNFRILAAKINDLIIGTCCLPGNNVQQYPSHFPFTGTYGLYNTK